MKKLTNINFKAEKKPRTVKEKYERLKCINPKLAILKETFDLEVQL